MVEKTEICATKTGFYRAHFPFGFLFITSILYFVFYWFNNKIAYIKPAMQVDHDLYQTRFKNK